MSSHGESGEQEIPGKGTAPRLPRYIVLCGCIISSDFFKEKMTAEERARVSTVGLTVLQVDSNLVFTTPTFLYASDRPCGDFECSAPSRAEKFALAQFMLRADPEHVHCFKMSTVFVDTVASGTRAISVATHEQARAVNSKYQRLRAEGEDVTESRMIRKVARLGTTDPRSRTSGRVEDDPDDVSGIEGEIAVMAREEERIDKHHRELETRRLSKMHTGRMYAILHSAYKRYQARNPEQFQQQRRAAGLYRPRSATTPTTTVRAECGAGRDLLLLPHPDGGHKPQSRSLLSRRLGEDEEDDEEGPRAASSQLLQLEDREAGGGGGGVGRGGRGSTGRRSGATRRTKTGGLTSGDAVAGCCDADGSDLLSDRDAVVKTTAIASLKRRTEMDGGLSDDFGYREEDEGDVEMPGDGGDSGDDCYYSGDV